VTLDVTAIIPWHGRDEALFELALASLPTGMPYLVAGNRSKTEMAGAINQAVDKAETRHVFLMGGDDIIGAECVERLHYAIGTADVAYPSMRLFRSDQGEPPNVVGECPVFPAEPMSVHRFQAWNMISGAFLARTETARKYRWRPVGFEDWDWHTRASRGGARYVPVPSATYWYRQHPGQTSHTLESAREETVRSEIAGDRYPVVATFNASGSEGIAYVRSVLPARYLPGVVFQETWDSRELFDSPMQIISHPNFDHDTVIESARRRGQSVVVDVDDDYLSDQLVPFLLTCGMDRHASLWAARQESHRVIVRAADAVICSTPELASRYASENKNVHVVPNSVDAADWSEMHPLRFDETLRVGWAAGLNHAQDASLVEPALRWASKQPGVEVLIMGHDPGWDFEYTLEPFTPSIQTYRDLLSMFDIGLAPVRPSVMNQPKSDLKWMEYAMAGVPTIASDCLPYRTIRNGDDGLLVRGKRGFTEAVKLLVGDDDLRLQLAINAAKRVNQTRTARVLRDGYLAVAASVGAITLSPEVTP